MTKRIQCYIIGAGGHGRVVLSILQAPQLNSSIEVIGFLSDLPEEHGHIVDGISVSGGTALLQKRLENDIYVIAAIGDNHKRAKIFNSLLSQGIKFTKALHPTAIIDLRAIIEDGVMICPGVIMNTGAHIGANSIINTGAIIEHDCKIGNHVHVAPGSVLTGNVTVGDLTLIGAGSTVLPGIVIGNNVIVGAGSVVTKNIPDNSIVAGVPAKSIRQ